ncbi:ependymin-2-like isoform X3 [Oryzias latipes]|uniref:ependymin-2-like isoform X3 n=1 Tax=Oryzias latipes TaxID=8090 RepID=UPI000CE1A2D5|nr:ependymin-2-like isoform X3 [Oryzias latipes]
MKLAVVLACFVVFCLAEKPLPCTSPPLLTGRLSVTTNDEKVGIFGKYLYDAVGQRVRLFEMGNFKGQTFTADVLLHFTEAAMYEINDAKRTCKKSPLKADFQPLKIPQNAFRISQTVVGSSSVPGQGLLMNNWSGKLPDKTGDFLTTVTELGCIPVSLTYKTKEFGWVLADFYDNVIGITNPNLLEPPEFCAGAAIDVEEEPRDYLSFYANENRVQSPSIEQSLLNLWNAFKDHH